MFLNKKHVHFIVLILIVFGSVMSSAIVKAQNPGPLAQRIISINQQFTAGKTKQAEQLAAETINDSKLMDSSDKALQLRAYLVYADILSRRNAYVLQSQALEKTLKTLDEWGFTVSRESVLVRNKLSKVYISLAKEEKAIKTLEIALKHADALFPKNDLAHVELQITLARVHTNRYEIDAAKKYIELATEITQLAKGKANDIAMGRVLQAEGELYFRMARTKDAADSYEKALTIRKKVLGEINVETGQSIVSLAGALKGLHDFKNAEEMYRSGFAVYEAQVGLEHPHIATLLNNIGQLYYLQGRYADSEKVLLRALQIKKKFFSPDHVSHAESLNHLGYTYYLQEDYKKAAKTLDEAIRIWSLPGYQRLRYKLSAVVWRSVIKFKQGNEQAALEDLNSALEQLVDIYGENSLVLATIYQEIGHIYEKQGKTQDAEQSYLLALDAAGTLSEGDRIEEILTNSDLALLQARDSRLQDAIISARKSIAGMQKRINRYSGSRASKLATELKPLREAAISHVEIIKQLLDKNQDADTQKLINESFLTAQISRSSNVAQALSRMAQRFAAKQGPLAKLVNQQQELQTKNIEIEGLLNSAIQKPAKLRDTKIEQALRQSSIKINADLKTAEAAIEKRFPEYAQLTKSQVLDLASVQALLNKDEAIVLYLFGQKQGFSWTITPNSASLHRIKSGHDKLKDDVKTLRSYMIPDAIAALSDIKPVPMDLAHGMFKELLEQQISGISANHLIVIADGALQSLPMSALVTKMPDQPIKTLVDHNKVAWLVNTKAVSVMPDIGSIGMLRKTLAMQGKTQTANFLGIGDPALKDASKQIALRSKQQLSTRGATTLRSIIGANRAAVDIDVVASMEELPDTANELKTIGDLLKAKNNDIYLRQEATQEKIETLKLDQYKVIQFATHGLMAGDFQGLFEPALVLTPTLSDDIQKGDGLLTASEITELKLNADMVVLSACNTAAPDGSPGAEGMSGLGRAFFYAGGRSLLLTHWAVLSDAAVAMTTGMFKYMKNDSNINKAEAARRSKIDIINSKDKPYYAHPLFWAPFTIVGEAGVGIS